MSWVQSPSALILEPKKRKSVTASTFSPSVCHEVMRPDAMILLFLILSFKPVFSLSSFTCIKRFFSSSSLSTIRVASSAYLRLLIFLSAVLILACNSSSPAFHMMCSVYKLNKQVTVNSLVVLLSQSWTGCSIEGSNCWFLTCMKVSQETGLVFSSLQDFSTVCPDPQNQRLQHSQWNRGRCFSKILFLSLWFSECWQFDLWFLCLF